MQFQRDKSTLYTPLLISIFLHLTIISLIPVGKQKKIITVSFPIELISLPPIREHIEKPETIVAPKIIPKKTKKVEKKKLLPPKPSTPAQPVEQVAKQPYSSLSVEAAKFPYMWYLNQIRKKIADNWIFSRETGNLRTVVYFRIKRDGEIDGPKLTDTSGDKFFDQICIRAVKLAEPFPPLPVDYDEEYLGVYFEFVFKE